jgi:7-cyano-7-deazaguanine reductase
MFKDTMILLKDADTRKILPAIDTFPCPYHKPQEPNNVVRIVFPEFTCVCPKTGYPDFASIDLYYMPARLCIELKSWKLYLNSFRMIGTFHETVTGHLFKVVKQLIKPKWLLLAGDFFPRGNVDTTVIFETGKRPAAADFCVKDYTPHCRSMLEGRIQ